MSQHVFCTKGYGITDSDLPQSALDLNKVRNVIATLPEISEQLENPEDFREEDYDSIEDEYSCVTGHLNILCALLNSEMERRYGSSCNFFTCMDDDGTKFVFMCPVYPWENVPRMTKGEVDDFFNEMIHRLTPDGDSTKYECNYYDCFNYS